jgi:membrane-associated phospholipid phosphatase
VPAKLIHWWLAAVRGPTGPTLILALDLAVASTVALILEFWISASLSPLRDSALSHLFVFVPNRVQLGLFFAVTMISLIAYRRMSRNNLAADQGMFILGCGAISGFWADILKIVFGRPRPDNASLDEIPQFHLFAGGDGFDSFPSSHAAIAAGLAGALSVIWPVHRLKFLGIAGVVAASRCITAPHYPSDALLGFAVGLLTVFVAQSLFSRTGIRLHSRRDRL